MSFTFSGPFGGHGLYQNGDHCSRYRDEATYLADYATRRYGERALPALRRSGVVTVTACVAERHEDSRIAVVCASTETSSARGRLLELADC